MFLLGLGRTKRGKAARVARFGASVCGPEAGEEGPDDSFENSTQVFKHPVPTNKPTEIRKQQQPSSSQTVRGTVRRGIRCTVFVWYTVSPPYSVWTSVYGSAIPRALELERLRGIRPFSYFGSHLFTQH